MQYRAVATRYLSSALPYLLALLFGLVMQAPAEVVIQDAFDRTGPLAKSVPAPINGPGAIWTCNGATGATPGILTESGMLKLSNLNEFASLPFNISYVPLNYLVSISAKITLSAGAGKSWIGLGFAGDNRLFRTGTAWLRLTSDGRCELVKGPGYATSPKTKSSVPLATDKPAELNITYHTGTNTATFSVNREKLGEFSYTDTPSVDRIFISTAADKEDALNGMLQNLKVEVSAAP